MHRDRMRIFAWILVVAGIVLVVTSSFYASWTTALNDDAWHGSVRNSWDQAKVQRTISMLDDGTRPAWVYVSPWRGVITGAAVAALGIILLAIHRPGAR